MLEAGTDIFTANHLPANVVEQEQVAIGRKVEGQRTVIPRIPQDGLFNHVEHFG